MQTLSESMNRFASTVVSWQAGAILDSLLLCLVVLGFWSFAKKKLSPQWGIALFLLVFLKAVFPAAIPVPDALARWTPSRQFSAWIQPHPFETPEQNSLIPSSPESVSDMISTVHTASPAELVRVIDVAPQKSVADFTLAAMPVTETAFAATVDENTPLPPAPKESIDFASSATILPASNPPAKTVAMDNAVNSQVYLSQPPNWPLIVLSAWAIVVIGLTARQFIRQRRFSRLVHGAISISDSEIPIDFDEIRRSVRLRSVELRKSNAIDSPIVYGLFRPVILLPEPLLHEVSPSELRWILLHELAHIKRRDLWFVLLSRIVSILFFFNPALWVSRRMIDRLREFACDDFATHYSNATPVEASEAFLKILRRVTQGSSSSSPALAALDSKNPVFQRMQRLLASDRRRYSAFGLGSFLLWFFLAAMLLPSLVAQEKPNEAPNQDGIGETKPGPVFSVTKPDEEKADKQKNATPNPDAKSLYESGKKAFQDGLDAEAKSLFIKFVESYPYQHHDMLVQVLYSLGELARKANSPQEAEYYYQQTMRIVEQSPHFKNSVHKIAADEILVKCRQGLLGTKKSLANSNVFSEESFQVLFDGLKKKTETLDPDYRELLIRRAETALKMSQQWKSDLVKRDETTSAYSEAQAGLILIDAVLDLAYAVGDRQTVTNLIKGRLENFKILATEAKTPTDRQWSERQVARTKWILEESAKPNPLTESVQSLIDRTLQEKYADTAYTEPSTIIDLGTANPLPNQMVCVITPSWKAEDTDDFRKEAVGLHRKFLQTEIAYLHGATGGTAANRERDRWAWLNLRVASDFWNGDLEDLRFAFSERLECAQNLLQAATVEYQAGIGSQQKLSEANLSLSEAQVLWRVSERTIPLTLDGIAALKKLPPVGEKYRLLVVLNPPPDRSSGPAMATRRNVTRARSEFSERSATSSGRENAEQNVDPDVVSLLEKRVEHARKRRDDLKELCKQNVVPEQELDAAELALLEAETALSQARKGRAAPVSPWLSMMAQPSNDPDYIALLEKRVEVARQKFEQVDSGFKIGHPNAPAGVRLAAQIELLNAEIALYQGTGETDKLNDALEKKVKTAESRKRWIKSAFEAGTAPRSELSDAELALAEAEYELKKQWKENSGSSPSPVSARTKKQPLFQGKTFEQWVEELQTELDPKMRAEAFRALAMFGANRRGKEATAAILDALKGLDFSGIDNEPIGRMKQAAVDAFASRDARIPLKDSLPALMEGFKSAEPGATTLAHYVFLQLDPSTKEVLPVFYEEALHWEMKGDSDPRPLFLLERLGQNHGGGEMILRFLRATLRDKDADRFQLPFARFVPARFREDGVLMLDDKMGSFGGGEFLSLGLFPQTVEGESVFFGQGTWMSKPRLTPYGKKLLELLETEGLSSENAAIKATSQKVVEALRSIGKADQE